MKIFGTGLLKGGRSPSLDSFSFVLRCLLLCYHLWHRHGHPLDAHTVSPFGFSYMCPHNRLHAPEKTSKNACFTAPLQTSSAASAATSPEVGAPHRAVGPKGPRDNATTTPSASSRLLVHCVTQHCAPRKKTVPADNILHLYLLRSSTPATWDSCMLRAPSVFDCPTSL